MWRNRYASSPASCARAGRSSCLRTSASSRSGRRPLPVRVSIALRWNSCPSTAPHSSTARSAGSSWSSRAASSAWIVGGTATSPPLSRASASISSRKSGLPLGGGDDPAAQLVVERREPVEQPGAVAESSSGSSSSVVAFHLPPPHPADARAAPAAPCRGAGSARPAARSATCSTRSRKVGSPQCRSSSTQTSGRRSASCSSSSRNAHAISGADVAASDLAEQRAQRGGRGRRPPAACRAA